MSKVALTIVAIFGFAVAAFEYAQAAVITETWMTGSTRNLVLEGLSYTNSLQGTAILMWLLGSAFLMLALWATTRVLRNNHVRRWH